VAKPSGKPRDWKITFGGQVKLTANSQEDAKDKFFKWYYDNEHPAKILKLEVVR
jgi:hypothetical protein